jgi:hypothetical protein
VALVEREAVTSPLDHAFGFELPDVRPGAASNGSCSRYATAMANVCQQMADKCGEPPLSEQN